MKTQATKCTPEQLKWRMYWIEQGYAIKPNQIVPEDERTPPCFVTDHPIKDAAIASAAIMLTWLGLYALFGY